jgi:hypothetical protein
MVPRLTRPNESPTKGQKLIANEVDANMARMVLDLIQLAVCNSPNTAFGWGDL